MFDPHDSLLALHVTVGSLGLILGPVAMWAERRPPYRSRAGAAYHWAVLAVSLSAVGLVALSFSAFWWLLPLVALSYGLALLGRLAPRRHGRRWVRMYVHGQGGSYIALVSALLVVSVDSPASVAAWVLPTLVGSCLIERRVARIRAGERTEQPRVPEADAVGAAGRC